MKRVKFIVTICMLAIFATAGLSSCTETGLSNTFDFTFDFGYDEKIIEVKVSEGKTVYEPIVTRENYEFAGWFLDETYADSSKYSFDSIVNSNTIVYAKWVRENNISFDTNGSPAEIESMKLKIGENFVVPDPGQRDNDEFIGWSDGSSVYQAGDVYQVTSEKDIKLTASWNKMFEVVFKDIDGKILKTSVVAEGASAVAPEVNSPSIYLKFTGWDGSVENVNNDIEVTAQYEYSATEDKYFTFVGYKPVTKYGSDDQPYVVYEITDVEEDIEYYEVMKSAVETMPEVVVLPKEYNGKPVKGIMDSTSSSPAFGDTVSSATSMNVFVIPNTYTKIGNYAFYSNLGLKAVVYEENSVVETIGNYAFALTNAQNRKADWSGNTFDVVIPASVKTIGDYAFYNNGKVSSLVFSDNSSLTTINRNAFALENNSNTTPSGITDIVIPASVVEIAQYAFGYQSYTTLSFEAESKLETIGNYAFAQSNNTKEDCSVKEVVFPSSLKAIGENAFHYQLINRVEFTGSELETISKDAFNYCYDLKEVVLSEGIKKIAESAFANNTSLKGVIIPGSVTSIDKNAFYKCPSLASLVFEDGEEALTIGENAFQNNIIVNLVITNRISSIGKNAFVSSGQLEKLTFEDGEIPLEIGQYAFAGATSGSSSTTFITPLFTKLNFPKRLTKLDNYAFIGCLMLTDVVFGAESNLKVIGTNAFQYTPNLKNVSLHEGLQTISANAFSNYGSSATSLFVKYNVKGKVVNVYSINQAMTTITIPSTVTSIGNMAFGYIIKLATINFAETPEGVEEVGLSIGSSAFNPGSAVTNTALKAVTIPARVTAIGASTFKDCTGLKTVTFEENSRMKLISANLFENCKSLETITIPAGVTEIGNFAFKNSDSLAEIVFEEGSMLTKIGNQAFVGTVLSEITLPSSFVTFGAQVFAENTVLENIFVEEDNNTYKSVDGILYNKNLTEIVMYPTVKLNSLIEYVAPDNLTSISTFAFSGAEKLESVDLNNVTKVGVSAFQGCPKLVSVDASKVTTWTNVSDYNRAFQNCVALTTVTLCPTLELLGGATFAGCSSLESIDLPDTLKAISAGLFMDTGLKSIDLPTACTKIEGSAFRGCDFTELVIPATVTDILTSAFVYCEKLRVIVIEGSISASSAVGTTFHNLTSIEYIIFKGDYDTSGKAGANIVKDYDASLFKGVYVNDAYYDVMIDRNATAAANYKPFDNLISGNLFKKLSDRPVESIIAGEGEFTVTVNTNLPVVVEGVESVYDYSFTTGIANLAVTDVNSWVANLSSQFTSEYTFGGFYLDQDMTISWTGVNDCQFNNIVLYTKWEGVVQE